MTQLLKNMKRLVIDLDGTLCEQKTFETYYEALPKKEVIEKLREYALAGWHITIFTARGMNTLQGNVSAIKKHLSYQTKKWLKENNVPYHRLRFGKPPADKYIDDKGESIDEFVSSKI